MNYRRRPKPPNRVARWTRFLMEATLGGSEPAHVLRLWLLDSNERVIDRLSSSGLPGTRIRGGARVPIAFLCAAIQGLTIPWWGEVWAPQSGQQAWAETLPGPEARKMKKKKPAKRKMFFIIG